MFDKYKQRKLELEKEKTLLESSVKEAKALHKDLSALKKTIDAYHKQGAILLLEDLDEDLIKKLQSFTEDNVIIIYTKSGDRVEIKKDKVDFVNKRSGAIK